MRYSVAAIKENYGLFTQVEGTAWVEGRNMREAARVYAGERGLKGVALSVRTERAIQESARRHTMSVTTWEVRV